MLSSAMEERTYRTPVWRSCLVLSVLFALLVFLQGLPAYPTDRKESVQRTVRQLSCPTPGDSEWQSRNSQCESGKTYHCLENREAEIITNDCYEHKICSSGSRPVVEGTAVYCRECPEGTFQAQDGLWSNNTRFSYCREHSPCDPKYGKKQCQAGTTSTDNHCECDLDRGYTQVFRDYGECDCFSANTFCRCDKTGCPNGTEFNDAGICVPVTSATTSASTSGSEPPAMSSPNPTEDSDTGHIPRVVVTVIVPIVVVVVVLVLVLGVVLVVWKRKSISQRCCHRFRDKNSARVNGRPGAEDYKPLDAATGDGPQNQPPHNINEHRNLYYVKKFICNGGQISIEKAIEPVINTDSVDVMQAGINNNCTVYSNQGPEDPAGTADSSDRNSPGDETPETPNTVTSAASGGQESNPIYPQRETGDAGSDVAQPAPSGSRAWDDDISGGPESASQPSPPEPAPSPSSAPLVPEESRDYAVSAHPREDPSAPPPSISDPSQPGESGHPEPSAPPEPREEPSAPPPSLPYDVDTEANADEEATEPKVLDEGDEETEVKVLDKGNEEPSCMSAVQVVESDDEEQTDVKQPLLAHPEQEDEDVHFAGNIAFRNGPPVMPLAT